MIPWVTVRVAVAKAEEGMHSCQTSGIALRSVVTHKPNLVGRALELLGNLCIAFRGFFRAGMGVKPVAEKFFKVTLMAVPVKQFLSLNTARLIDR